MMLRLTPDAEPVPIPVSTSPVMWYIDPMTEVVITRSEITLNDISHKQMHATTLHVSFSQTKFSHILYTYSRYFS